LVTGGGETEQTIGPVENAQNALFEKSTHLMGLCWGGDQSPGATKGMLKACYSYGLKDHMTNGGSLNSVIVM
jgi:hypothetical protein